MFGILTRTSRFPSHHVVASNHQGWLWMAQRRNFAKRIKKKVNINPKRPIPHPPPYVNGKYVHDHQYFCNKEYFHSKESFIKKWFLGNCPVNKRPVNLFVKQNVPLVELQLMLTAVRLVEPPEMHKEDIVTLFDYYKEDDDASIRQQQEVELGPYKGMGLLKINKDVITIVDEGTREDTYWYIPASEFKENALPHREAIFDLIADIEVELKEIALIHYAQLRVERDGTITSDVYEEDTELYEQWDEIAGPTSEINKLKLRFGFTDRQLQEYYCRRYWI